MDKVQLINLGYGATNLKEILRLWNKYIKDDYKIIDCLFGKHIKHFLIVDEKVWKELKKDKGSLCKPIIEYNNKYRDRFLTNYSILTEEMVQEILNKYNNRNKNFKPVLKNETKILKQAYIYGIFIEGELVYIGKTNRKVQERIKEHIDCVLNKNIQNSQQRYLYQAMRECQGYNFEILYSAFDSITNRQLEEKEKILIETLLPKYNYEGVKIPYRFSSER